VIVVDAGPLYAYIDRTDEFHQQSVDLIRGYGSALLVPMLVIAKVAHFLLARIGPQGGARFLSDLTSGRFSIEPVAPGDWLRVSELVIQYHDLPLGTVDASVVTLAERYEVPTIATFDRRHFTVVRPVHVDAFDLVP